MTIEPTPELPDMQLAPDEFGALTEMLDYYRAVLARKVSGLSSSQLAQTVAPSDLTLGALIYHMALVEDTWFEARFLGNDDIQPWASADWDSDPDWEMHQAGSLSPAQLIDQFTTSVARSRATTEVADSLDRLTVKPSSSGAPWNLRWILVHMIEEYARHCGHADFLRQSIDGVTGD